MDIRQIRQFLALAEAKNFYRAAENIGLTQSALTQAISKLEKELDLQLFIRGKNGTVLTAHGRRFRDHARIILAQFEAARTELRAIASGQQRTIKVGIVESLSDSIVLDALSPFLRRYPHYNITIIKDWSTSLLPRLLSGSLDFAFLSDHFLSQEIPELRRETLFEDTVSVVVSAKHPLGNRRAIGLKDLISLLWVAVATDRGWAENLTRVFAAADLHPPHQIMHTNSFTLATELIRRGEAVGLVSPQLFQHATDSRSSLRFFDVPELRQARHFSIYYRARTVMREPLSDLVGIFKNAIRQKIVTGSRPKR